MSIKVKAIERKLKFQKEAVGEYRYVLQPELYNKLSASKCIAEAALRSGISKGVIQAGWDAIGAVLVAWATEGHSVAIPGLGTLRFGVRAKAVADVNKVGTDLITSRRTFCKSSYVLIVNTYRLLCRICDTFMFPNYWEAQNHFPWVLNKLQNMPNFE